MVYKRPIEKGRGRNLTALKIRILRKQLRKIEKLYLKLATRNEYLTAVNLHLIKHGP